MGKKLKNYTVLLQIETKCTKKSKREAVSYGSDKVKKLGLEITNIKIDDDFDKNYEKVGLEIMITLEGSKKAEGTAPIIKDILLTCRDQKIEVNRINCFREYEE